MSETDPAGSAPPPARTGPSWTDLGPRIISAIVIIAIVATALYFGSYIFAGVVGVVVALAYREWDRMVTLQPLTALGAVLIGLVAISGLAYPYFGPFGPLATLAVIVIACAISLLGPREAVAWRVGGLVFFAAVIIACVAMRGLGAEGVIAGWFLGIVVAMNDTGAYFVGRVVGGEKLVPAISPAKTWSGAIGGWVIGTAAGTIFWVVFNSGAPGWVGLALAGVMGVLGQIGDLTESAIKRRFRVKDSGDIIPGHGGLMDRLDSITFAVLFVFVVGALRGGDWANVAGGFLHW